MGDRGEGERWIDNFFGTDLEEEWPSRNCGPHRCSMGTRADVIYVVLLAGKVLYEGVDAQEALGISQQTEGAEERIKRAKGYGQGMQEKGTGRKSNPETPAKLRLWARPSRAPNKFSAIC